METGAPPERIPLTSTWSGADMGNLSPVSTARAVLRRVASTDDNSTTLAEHVGERRQRMANRDCQHGGASSAIQHVCITLLLGYGAAPAATSRDDGRR